MLTRRIAAISLLIAAAAGPIFAQMFGAGRAAPDRDKASWGLCTSGPCATGTDLTVHYIVVAPSHLQKCYLEAKTAPAGADLIVDVLKNGITSIFGASQFALTDGTTTASTSTFATPDLGENDTLTVSIAQIGSTTPGAGVSLVCTLTSTSTATAPAALTAVAQDKAPVLSGDSTVIMKTAGTERMRITSGGNVGIGTAGPSDKLTIVTGAGATAIRTTDGTVSTTIFNGGSLAGGSIGTTSNHPFGLFANNQTPAVVLTAAGNVGIGTTTFPQWLRLDVKGSNGLPAASGTVQPAVQRIEGTLDIVLDAGIASGTPYAGWLQATNRVNLGLYYPLSLNPNGGAVGIGTTTPTVSGTGKFHAAGNTVRPVDALRTPASAAEACNTGEIAFDAAYVYTCVAANTWRRAATASW